MKINLCGSTLLTKLDQQFLIQTTFKVYTERDYLFLESKIQENNCVYGNITEILFNKARVTIQYYSFALLQTENMKENTRNFGNIFALNL